MYSILLNDNNELIATHRERIMQRSKLVDSFRILLKKEYKDKIDMSEFDANLEYVLPVSKKYKSEKLTLAESESDEGYLECSLPFDTALTTEPGDIEIQITLIKVDMDADGQTTQYVRKSSTCNIVIVPISAWSDLVPDEALNAVDQAFIKAEAMIKSLNDIADALDQTKADNIAINDDGEVQLKAKGDYIGDSINVAIPGTEDEDSRKDGIYDLDDIYSTVQI